MIPTQIPARTLFYIFLGLILISIAGLRPVGIDKDSGTYSRAIRPSSFTIQDLKVQEPAFLVLREINHLLFQGGEKTFFLLFAILGVALKLSAVRELSYFPILSIFTYISIYFILHEMTQIRVGVASALFLLSIPDVYNRNMKSFLVKMSIAFSFHYSSLVMGIAYFLHPNKINHPLFLLLPFIGMAFGLINDNLAIILSSTSSHLPAFIAQRVSMHISLFNEGSFSKINILNFYYTSLFIVYYLIYFNLKNFTSRYDVLLTKCLGIAIFSFFFFSPLPVFAFRLSEFFGVVVIILIPHLLFILKQKSIGLILIIIWLATYFASVPLSRLLNWQIS